MSMENSSSRVIEITVISGEDLRIDRRLIKKNAFTIVETDAFNYHTTKVDESGGSYPTWNEKLVIELPMHARFINLHVKYKVSSSSGTNNNKTVGLAKIPVSDFIEDYVPENYLHFLSYRLRDAKGEKNGIINVSVRVKISPEYATASNLAKARLNVQGYSQACSSQATGLNVQGYASYSSLTPIGFGDPIGGAVTGVPVWCANRA